MIQKIICENENDLIKELAHLIERVSHESINRRRAFNIGFSGGSLVTFLTLGLPKITTDFSKWKVFFCDERVVTEDSPNSTFGAYKKELLPKIPLKEHQFVRIKQGVSAKEAAVDYTQKLKSTFGNELPRFDMLLLGMGPDGHTCSLFPFHRLLDESQAWVMHITDSPKPPSNRITLTFPVINNARYCVFALSGEGKADIIKRCLEDKEESIPCTKVQPTDGNIYWILDQYAAKFLHY